MDVVLLIGLQGTGKTTFYHARFAATHVHLSKDLWPNARRKQARLEQLLEEALSSGRSVVVDNTNVSRLERAPVIAIARAHCARVVGYYFASPVEEALARNARREGRARVPDVAIRAFARRLEPPRLEEGFDALFEVRLAGASGFEVTTRGRAAGYDVPS
jgi:predicted kinase